MATEPTVLNLKKRPSPRAAFTGVFGINAFWPLGGPQADIDPATNQLRWRPQPFTFLFAHAPFSVRHVPDATRKRITDAGYDHIRIQYHPGPLMQALEKNDTGLLNYMLDQFDDCVTSLTTHGVGVILSAIPTGYASLHTIDQILSGYNTPMYNLYKEHLEVLALRYKHIDPKLLMIELINEPPGNGSTTVRPNDSPKWGPLYTGDWATGYQPDLYALMRGLMPKHTIGMCSDGWQNWETMTQLVPTPEMIKDKNLIWSFHPIFPVPAAQQGYIYNQYQYIERLHYPPGAGGQTLAEAKAVMVRNVNRDSRLSAQQKADTIAGLNYDLEYYFNTPQDREWIYSCYKKVRDWANQYGIPIANVSQGEFGMVRDNTGFPNNVIGLAYGYLGGTRVDRIHLYRDNAAAGFACGFRSIPDHLDTLDYGITFGVNNNIGEFDPLIQDAIATYRIPVGLNYERNIDAGE